MASIELISIEGNIGSGKSTLLVNLKKHFQDDAHIVFLREPVDEWSKIQDEHGVTILEKFYEDQEKYSFSFQMMAYISRLKLLKDAVEHIKLQQPHQKFIIITERSLFTDKMVFAKMLFDSKKIEHINYQIYLNWFNTFAEEFKVNKIIYIKAEPEICYERVGKRGRDGEDNIPLDYLTSCNTYHEAMLDKSSDACVCFNQLVLDGNVDIFQNQQTLDDWISSICAFLTPENHRIQPKSPDDNPRKKIHPGKFELYFDGCSKGNPGLAGAGAVLYEDNVEVWTGSVFVGENSTNNQAEYSGLILGLKQALSLRIRNLEVFGDSSLVAEQMRRNIKCKSPNLLDLHKEAARLAREFDEISFYWILRDRNKRADALANMGVSCQSQIPAVPVESI